MPLINTAIYINCILTTRTSNLLLRTNIILICIIINTFISYSILLTFGRILSL